MQEHDPGRKDALNEFEQRLANWRPAAPTSEADRMLFAAGRAVGRKNAIRPFWPALSGVLALLVVSLGVWGTVERSRRIGIAEQLAMNQKDGFSADRTGQELDPRLPASESQYDYYNLRQRIEQESSYGPDAQALWSPAPETPQPSIIRSGGLNDFLNH